MDQLNFPIEVKSITENGFFAGYASIFDYVDNQNDVVLRGAFENSLKEKNYGEEIKLLWQHDPAAPIGFFSKVVEDRKGLYVEGFLLLDVQKGREAYTLLKSGAVSGLSIGYGVKYSNFDKVSGVRIISELDLHEISLVTFPANKLAKVAQVKSEVIPLPKHMVHLSDALDKAMVALEG